MLSNLFFLALVVYPSVVLPSPLEGSPVAPPAPPQQQGPNQQRQAREAYGPGHGLDRGYHGGDHVGGYEREVYGPREDYGGRYGHMDEYREVKEIIRPEIVEKIYERDFYGPREEHGRGGYGYGYGYADEIIRPEIIEKVERIERPYGRHGYEREYYGGGHRDEYGRGYGYGEELIRPEIIEKVVERVDRGYGGRCNCGYDKSYELPRHESLYGYRHGYEGGFPGLCIPYPQGHRSAYY